MNDETLTLYYYNDGLTNAERQQVANTLATDAEVAARYHALCLELERIADPDISPPADMVQRWHDSLDRAATRERQANPGPVLHSWSFLLGAGVTAALAIGIGIGIFIGGDEPVAPVMEDLIADTRVPAPDASSAFLRGLQVHLRDSERGLTALAPTDNRTELILSIIEQNKLFERAAEQNDSANLARVLRAFELVLVRLAAEDLSPEEAEALRTKLLFELNVMLTKLSRDSSDEQQAR